MIFRVYTTLCVLGFAAAFDPVKWSAPPPEPDCNAVDAAYHTENWPPLFPKRSARVHGKCELMVVWAGMPRAGSTLAMKIGQEVLERLAEAHGFKSLGLDYWRFDRHMEGKANWLSYGRNASLARMLQSIPQDARVLEVKLHEYDSEVMKMCDKTLVVTTTRDPVDILSSAVGANWVKHTPNEPSGGCGTLYRYLDDVYRNGKCWQHRAGLHFSYTEMVRDMPGSARKLEAKISAMMKLNKAIKVRVSTVRDEANKHIPHSSIKDFGNRLVPGCAPSVLRKRYAFFNKDFHDKES